MRAMIDAAIPVVLVLLAVAGVGSIMSARSVRDRSQDPPHSSHGVS